MMKAAMDIVTVCYYTDVLCTTFMLLIMLFTITVTIKIILYTTVDSTPLVHNCQSHLEIATYYKTEICQRLFGQSRLL